MEHDRYYPEYYLETMRIREAKHKAAAEGLELLTPLAARTLFRRSGEAIRKAVRLGRVDAPFTLKATDRDVSLISLESAIVYWGFPDYVRLDKMRGYAHNIAMPLVPQETPDAIGIYRGYNVLHSKPLVSRSSEAVL